MSARCKSSAPTDIRISMIDIVSEIMSNSKLITKSISLIQTSLKNNINMQIVHNNKLNTPNVLHIANQPYSRAQVVYLLDINLLR